MFLSMTRLLAFVAVMILSLAPCHADDLVSRAESAGTFKTFVASIRAAGLVASLQTDGPFTVFAPSDAAFAKLPPATLAALMKDKVRLAQVLSHLIVPGKIMVADVRPGQVKTIQGDAIVITSDNGKLTVDGANVTQSDVIADNGVMHVIDTVIMPK